MGFYGSWNDCGCQSGRQQFCVGRPGNGLHHRRRVAAQRTDALFADSQISVCHQNHHRAYVPQKGCLGRRHDAVSGCLHGAGGHGGHRQHCRCGGCYRHRRAGRGVLDVVLGAAGHVHQICGGHAGRAFPGTQRGRRVGRRPDVLHQKRPGQALAVSGGALLAVRRADGFRHRQRHTGEHDCGGH